LLFLAAGSVIIGMHHNQDIRYMGGVRKYMKITWLTSLIGSLALIGFPLFSGFYSKDTIIEAVHESTIFGHSYANFAVLAGVFVTAFYSFRMYFLVFHGKERYDQVPHDEHHHDDHGHDTKPHESSWVVTVPLILLAIPSVILGYFGIGNIVHGDWFKGVITVAKEHDTLSVLTDEFHGAMGMAVHGLLSLPFALAMTGVALAFYLYVVNPALPARLRKRFSGIVTILEEKYYFDRFNDFFFAGGARRLGETFFQYGDRGIIDGAIVNGSSRGVAVLSGVVRHLQTGYVYHYAFVMVAGVLAFLTWLLLR
jgi:NADH-quinone oxidoreductase subunit L